MLSAHAWQGHAGKMAKCAEHAAYMRMLASPCGAALAGELAQTSLVCIATSAVRPCCVPLQVLAKSRVYQEQQAKQIQAQLQRAQSEFFVQEEAALNK
jgi:hypothetical protein